jgi:cytochrome c553
MPSRSTVLVAVAAMALALPLLTNGQEASGEGDPQRGKQLAYTCYGCHGISNYKNVYPTYSVPKLQGQYAEYLASALAAYNKGERSHSTMHAQAATMTEQDMKDIAAFLAGKSLQPDPASKPEGKMPEKAEKLCISCHGADGIGITPLYPTLAGQHADFLLRALLDYQNGSRRNAVMSGFVADLTGDEMRELAEYYSKQRAGLTTAEHATWFGESGKD